MPYLVAPSGPLATNAYIYYCDKSRSAAFIDPAPESTASLQALVAKYQLEPKAIFLTHSHWDHITDISHLLAIWPKLELWVHPLDRGNLENPGSDRIPVPFLPPPLTPTHLWNDQQQLHIGQSSIEILHTPGHTPGGVCIYIPQEQLLFAGDTLFKGTFGSLSLPTSSAPDMWRSLKKLAKLPANTRVLPGHGISTTIERESSWLTNAQNIFGE